MEISAIADDVIVYVAESLNVKGVFYPVDLLIQQNCLCLQDYVSWARAKDRSYLVQKMDISSEHISELLEFACRIAEEMGAHRIEFERLEMGKPPIREKELRKLFEVIYTKEPMKDFNWFNLMMASSFSKVILEHLLADTPGKSTEYWEKVKPLLPEWWPWLYELEMLMDAKGGDLPTYNDLKWIETNLVPIVNRVFGINSHQFLAPVWRKLKALTEAKADWGSDPAGRFCSVKLAWYLKDRTDYQRGLCELFWTYPDFAESAMERLPDKDMKGKWDQFCEEEMSSSEFPSYLLIKGYIRRDLDIFSTVMSPSFLAAKELLSSPKDNSLRKRLQSENPKLLALFLRPIE